MNLVHIHYSYLQLDQKKQESITSEKLEFFSNFINLEPNKKIEERCNYFTKKGTKDANWAFNCIVNFLQFQKQ
jgi:hypothetical protein